MQRILGAFEQKAQELISQDKKQDINLQEILFPCKGKISEHEQELERILRKYVLLQADKCRGNYILVCKNLYIRQCVQALHAAPEYQKIDGTPADLVTKLLQEISGLLHHSHFQLLLDQERDEVPYFYTLPKPHKSPIGWRPVAATHRSVLEVPQRLLSQCLEKVMKTLRDFHYKEFQETKIRKYWIVENSLDVVTTLPEIITSMTSSDIDSMYQNMDQDCVIRATSEEIMRAADIVGVDCFFVSLGNTSHGNKTDQCFWYNSESGLDPTDNSICSTKEGCSRGEVYPLQNILNILIFLIKNSYVALGNSTHHQINGIPQGGNSSGHVANLTCHNYERKFVDKYPFHRLQYAISRFMGDFGITNAPYFQDMFRDIYPPETGIRLIPNRVTLKPGQLVQCKLLDLLIYVENAGTVHVTLYDKRDDYNFFVDRIPDIDSNVSRAQSISTFYGEIVRLFIINTHPEGFMSNVAQVAAYLIERKKYPKHSIVTTFCRFLDTQKGNPRLPGSPKDQEVDFNYLLTKKLTEISTP
jgi:hypothetical protein